MNDSRIRTVLLVTFLFVTSLVVAKAGLNWSRVSREDTASTVSEKELEQLEIELRHLEKLSHLKENEERIREHAQRLAEKIADEVQTEVEIHAGTHEFDFNYDYDFDIKNDRDYGELMIRERFDVGPGGEVVIKVPGADVEVLTGLNNQAELSVFLSARDMDRARSFFEDLRFELDSDGNQVSVRTRSHDKGRWGWKGKGHARITVRAVVPSEFNGNIATSGGDVSVERLQGNLSLATSGGDVEIGSIDGRDVDVTSSGGDIAARELRGETKITTSGGDIELGSVVGPSIKIRTSGGDIEASRLEANTVEAHTSGGDISIAVVSSNSAVRTSGGDIEIGRVDGDLAASTSGGDIEVVLSRPEEVSLSTTGGSIDILAPSSHGARLELNGRDVNVESSATFSGTRKKDHVSGSINGGGPTIRASSTGGQVEYRTRD